MRDVVWDMWLVDNVDVLRNGHHIFFEWRGVGVEGGVWQFSGSSHLEVAHDFFGWVIAYPIISTSKINLVVESACSTLLFQWLLLHDNF